MADALPGPQTDSTTSASRQQSGGFVRFCVRTVLVLGALLFFLPTFIGWVCTSPRAVAWVSGQPAGTIEVGQATFRWQGPVQLKDVIVHAPNGDTLANVSSLISERSLWDLLTARAQPLKLKLDGIHITARIDDPEPPQGQLDLSELTDALQTFQVPRPTQAMEMTVSNGSIAFQNAQGEPLETWTGISGTYAYGGSGEQYQDVTINIPEGDGNGTGPATLRGRWTLSNDPQQTEIISLQGEGDRVSVRPADVWLQKYLGPDHGLTACTGQVEAEFRRDRRSGWELNAVARLNENSEVAASMNQVAFAEPGPPRAELDIQSRYSKPDDQLTVPRLHVAADDAAVDLEGSVREISGQQIFKVLAEVQTSGNAILDVLPAELREAIDIEGMKLSQISITGSLLPSFDGKSQPLTYSLIASWDRAAAYGLQSENGQMKISFSEGQVRAEPIDVEINGGKLLKLPVLDLQSDPPTLRFEKGVMLEGIELTENVCRDWMKYVSPTLADATSAEGRLSVILNGGEMVLGQPEKGQLSGTVAIRDGQVKPGPLAVQILQQVGQVQQLINQAAQNLAQTPFMTMPQEDVLFEMRDGRVYHQNFGANITGMRLTTAGSVGLDQSLDLQLQLAFPQKWQQNVDRPVLQALVSQPIAMKIGGTLETPEIDASGMAQFGKEIGIKAGVGILERLIERRIERKQRNR